MWKTVLIGIVLGIDLVNACLPGTGFGLGYPTYSGYSPYAYSYNYPASYGVPFKSRHEPSDDTKTPLLASTDGTNGCVTKFDNSRLTCATPFERRPLSTEADCQKLCFENILKCQSFEFSSLTATCDLYSVPPPEGVLVAARTSPRSPFADEPIKDKDDYSYRKRFRRQLTLFDQQDPLKLPQFPNYCEPEVVPAVGSTFYVPNLECSTSNAFSESIESFSRQERLPSSVASILPNSRSSSQVIPEMSDCRDGGRARIQLIDGIAFIPEKSAVAKIQLDSADVCLLLCRNNAYLDGTRFQRPCVAAAFDRGTGRCTIMDEAISPNGQLQYTPHADSVYFEKMCIPVAELPMNCDDVVHRIPQRVLDGQADATVDAATQVDCIRRCVTASRLLGFTCQSATYYFEFPSQNCILNRFTRVSKPDSFAAELRQKVDYMELSPCMITGWQQRDAAWSEWSDCSKTLTRTRKRNCTDCDKKEEISPCVAPASFQEEFPSITKNLDADLVPVPRTIATNFDSAKAMKKHNIPDDEKSLFGEHDYENQNEISYFGPPRNEQKRTEKNNLLDGNKIEDITSEAMKELELAAIKEAESHKEIREKERRSKAENYEQKFPNIGEGIGIVEYGNEKHETSPSYFEGSYGNSNADGLTEKSYSNSNVDNSERPKYTNSEVDGFGGKTYNNHVAENSEVDAFTEKPVGIKPVQLSPIAATDSIQNCDPTKDCCPLIDLSGRKSRGCTLGFRINEKHQQEGCVPDDCKHKAPIGFRFYI